MSQASIVMIYTAPVATFFCCFPALEVATWPWLLEAAFLFGITGLTWLCLERDLLDEEGCITPVFPVVRWLLLRSFVLVLLLPFSFLFFASSAGSNHSVESAPVLL